MMKNTCGHGVPSVSPCWISAMDAATQVCRVTVRGMTEKGEKVVGEGLWRSRGSGLGCLMSSIGQKDGNGAEIQECLQ